MLPRAILFDLDGTLADTAPDLAAAVYRLCTERGRPHPPYAQLRAVASNGESGMIGASLHLGASDADYEPVREAFLDYYAADIAVKTQLFDGVAALLTALAAQGLQWGIVTNKPCRFTDALVPLISLQDAGCVISGDTTPHAKPHPAPLLEAAHRLGIAPQHCWYVGDDLRDIHAGRAAGMTTIAATWGYCVPDHTLQWNADAIIDHPLALLDLLKLTDS